ncbi:MAG: DNA polymerase III subunit delta' [Lachnospiraceae bacterium]|nr:DNA polymerase III subunit delta' [Lachnospiraceae bacterium]
MRFCDIIGQNEIKEHLQKAISGGKVSHAYIINGEKGMGKRMMAQAFVQTLFCEKHGVDACEECPECGKVSRRNHPDVIYIQPEPEKKNIGIDDIRQQLVSDVYIRPYSREIKVYIIPDADLLNPSCQNAILKTIEEPPEYVRLLLLTENAQRLLPTIRSRCIQLDLKPVVNEDEKIRAMLIREYELPEYVTESILQFAQGNIGKALSLAGSDRFQSMLDNVFSLVSHVDSMKAWEIAQKADQIKKAAAEEGFDLKEY